MKVNVRADSVEIEGYVNAIERNSKTLRDRIGEFIERVCKGAFSKALKRNNDIKILLNHDKNRELGSTKQGNLELKEDNIGLHARATITDPEVIDDARNNRLIGWSFGFYDIDVDRSMHEGVVYRTIRDLDLKEVSILNNKKSPAYEGTLIMARADDREMLLRGEDFIDEVSITEKIEPQKEENALKNENTVQNEEVPVASGQNEKKEEESPLTRVDEEPKQQEVVENINTIDYSKYETMIKEMKEE